MDDTGYMTIYILKEREREKRFDKRRERSVKYRLTTSENRTIYFTLIPNADLMQTSANNVPNCLIR